MAEKDIRRYSSEEIKAMNERGEYVSTPVDAPTVELGDRLWAEVEALSGRANRVSVHLRLDPETAQYFRDNGPGHLTRMATVLKAYARTKRGA